MLHLGHTPAGLAAVEVHLLCTNEEAIIYEDSDNMVTTENGNEKIQDKSHL